MCTIIQYVHFDLVVSKLINTKSNNLKYKKNDDKMCRNAFNFGMLFMNKNFFPSK